MVRTPCFHCREHGFNPWSGTRIRQAAWCGQIKKKQKQKTDEEFDMFTKKLLSWRYIIHLMKHALQISVTSIDQHLRKIRTEYSGRKYSPALRPHVRGGCALRWSSLELWGKAGVFMRNPWGLVSLESGDGGPRWESWTCAWAVHPGPWGQSLGSGQPQLDLLSGWCRLSLQGPGCVTCVAGGPQALASGVQAV